MNTLYTLFGLRIASAIPLPAQPCADPLTDGEPEVVIEWGEVPDALAQARVKGVRFQAGPGQFLLRVDGVARYHVQGGCRITVMPEPGAAEDDILAFLMGSALGSLLHQRGRLVLHASAVVLNGSGVAIAGPSGVGKSTLAAALHRKGHPFLADDLCAVTTIAGKPVLLPGLPHFRLWGDCLNKLDIDRSKLRAVRWEKDLEKYYLPVAEVPKAPVPLKALLVMDKSNEHEARIAPVRGRGKVTLLMGNTYRLRFLEGLGGKDDHFTQCTSVAQAADCYRVLRPDHGFRLQELAELIEGVVAT